MSVPVPGTRLPSRRLRAAGIVVAAMCLLPLVYLAGRAVAGGGLFDVLLRERSFGIAGRTLLLTGAVALGAAGLGTAAGVAHLEDRPPGRAPPDRPAGAPARRAVLRGGLHRGHRAGTARTPPAGARTLHRMGAASRDLRFSGRLPGARPPQLSVRVPGGPRPVRGPGRLAGRCRAGSRRGPLAPLPAGDPAAAVHRPAVRRIAGGPLHPERLRRRFAAALRDLHLGHLQPGPRIAGPPYRRGARPAARVRDPAGARRRESVRRRFPPVSRGRAVPAAPHPRARRLEVGGARSLPAGYCSRRSSCRSASVSTG